MAAPGSPDALCARLAAQQHGLITREQAKAAGLSTDSIYRRIKDGSWEPIYRGVYRFAHTLPTWRQLLHAACLWAGPDAPASHRSAAALLQLDGFIEGIVEISTATTAQDRNGLTIVHRRLAIPRSEITVLDGIPVTRPPRTLLDLGAVVEADRVEIALESALRKGLISSAALSRFVERRGGSGHRGSAVIKSLLRERNEGQAPTESILEARVRRLLRKAGLPQPVSQYELREGSRVIARIDFAYPESLVAIEADGFVFHSGRSAWNHDRARRNALTSRGWRVLHVTWDDLTHRPQELIQKIRNALQMAAKAVL